VLPLLVGPVVVGAVVLDVLALLVDVLVSLVDVLVSLVGPEVVLLVPGSVVGPQPRAISSVVLSSMRDRPAVKGEDRAWAGTAQMGCIEHRRYRIAGIGAGCADDETSMRGWISAAVVACRPDDECDRARSSDAG